MSSQRTRPVVSAITRHSLVVAWVGVEVEGEVEWLGLVKWDGWAVGWVEQSVGWAVGWVEQLVGRA